MPSLLSYLSRGLLSAAVLSLFTLPACADNTLDDGIFIAAKFGGTKLKSPNQNLLNSTSATHRPITPAWGANIGYLYFDTNYLFTAVQLGFNDYGDTSYKANFGTDSANAKVFQYDFDMLFDIGLAAKNGLNLIGKLGIARVTQDFIGRDANTEISFTGDRDHLTRYRPKAELDLGYICNSSTDLVLAYSHIFGTSNNNFPVNDNNIFTNNTLMLTLDYVLPE